MAGDEDPGAGPGAGPWVRLAGEDGDGAIDSFELVTARRALALVKGRLGRARLLDLLQDEIAAGTSFLRTQVERSAGETLTGTTTLRAHGITAAEFTGWLSRAFGREDVLLAGHPEHYAIHPADGTVQIVETLGEHVCSFFMREWDESALPDGALPDGEQRSSDAAEVTDAPGGRRSRMVLEDGTVVGSISNSFEEEDGGFTARLSVTLPVTCGPPVVDQHLEHFAVEFRNWILAAATERPA